MQFNAATRLFFILSVVLLAACSNDGPIESIQKLASPSGEYELQLAKLNYGATVAYVYRLYVLKSGQEIEDIDQDVLRMDNDTDFSFKWTDEDSISLQCIKGRIFKFNNFSYVNDKEISIDLNTKCITIASRVTPGGAP